MGKHSQENPRGFLNCTNIRIPCSRKKCIKSCIVIVSGRIILSNLQEKFKDIIVMHPGIPSRASLQEQATGLHFICVLDDLQSKCIKKESGVSELFCVVSHALNMSIIFVGHSIFARSESVIIIRNLHSICLMRDRRDKLPHLAPSYTLAR